uniref:Uncharacterized protein n=1 Tax=Anguilla anguilla TaxID=7936 RepID=A0A0E9QM31_ANGAN
MVMNCAVSFVVQIISAPDLHYYGIITVIITADIIHIAYSYQFLQYW